MAIGRRLGRGALLAAMLIAGASPGYAYLFWTRPALGSGPATGDDPALVIPLTGAKPAEQQANLVWAMRAGLNVAALQCQFAPTLRTVDNYNNMLRQHSTELQSTYAALSAYFKRTGGKTWQTALDSYTTRTYNGFSTLKAQLIFCETAASIGRQAFESPRGKLATIAGDRMREFRNSLIPIGDSAFAFSPDQIAVSTPGDINEPPPCFDKRGRPCKVRR